MKPERTIQTLMENHPHLFFTRQKCLNYLFVVVGTNYMWRDGELIDCDLIEFQDEYTDKAYADIAKAKHPWTEEDLYNYNKGLEKQFQICLKEPEPGKRKWYPIHWSNSLIMQIPSDITPEWKTVVEECKAMLLEDGIDIDHKKLNIRSETPI